MEIMRESKSSRTIIYCKYLNGARNNAVECYCEVSDKNSFNMKMNCPNIIESSGCSGRSSCTLSLVPQKYDPVTQDAMFNEGVYTGAYAGHGGDTSNTRTAGDPSGTSRWGESISYCILYKLYRVKAVKHKL